MKRDQGFVLVVALVLLVILTIAVVTGINLSNSNLRIVGNAQLQQEARSAAEQAINTTISSLSTFTATTPAASTVNVDMNNDGTNDYTVNVQVPTCLYSRASPGYEYIPGGSTTTSPSSRDHYWEVDATVSNSNGAVSDVAQGVKIVLPATNCP